jgi:maleamate amidohydrolase
MDASEVYTKQNLGGRVGWGQRPALVLVDFVNGFNDPDLLGGGNIPDAINHSAQLLGLARTLRLPIAFTRIVYQASDANAGAFCRKIPALAALTEDNPASAVVPQLAPRPGEYIIRKTQASSFFGTDLAAWLIWNRVDTLIVTGCTTSGCVRATVIDSASWNFRTIVPRECVGDRAIGPHEANLFDMDAKYADVESRSSVERHLREFGQR